MKLVSLGKTAGLLKAIQIAPGNRLELSLQAFCDLDFVSGPPFITVLPMQTATVLMTIKPWRRGLFDGVISFVSDEAVTLKLGLDK